MTLPRLLIVVLLAIVGWKLIGSAHTDSVASDISPDHEVVIFTAEWCGYCDQARDYLVRNRVEFLEIDIDSSTEANRRWRDAGGRGVPLAFIGDQRMAGFSAPAYRQALDQL
ncbi:MAG: glutaredoxin family protein [Wenzhouxiangella sp.]